MPSVDDVLRHAFEPTDDDWVRRAPAAHSAVLARHRYTQRMHRGLGATALAVAASAAVVVAMSTGDVRDSRGVEPADRAPTPTAPALSSPLEGTWTSGLLDGADVRVAARAAGAPGVARDMLAVLPRAPFRVVVVVRGANLESSVQRVAGRPEVLDRESLSVEGNLLTVRPFAVSARTVHSWSIDGDELTMDFRSTTEGEDDAGVPGEAWQRLLYDSVTFTR